MTPRTIVLALVAATLTVVGLAGPTAYATNTEPSSGPTFEATAITEGSLVWGLKESWRNYIGPDGTSVEDGASMTEEGSFSFPITSGSYDPATGTTSLTLAGAVHFQAYCTDVCLLDTRYSNLTVEISPTTQMIRGDWTGRLREDPSAPPESATDAELAVLEIDGHAPTTADGITSWTAVPSVAAAGFMTYAEGTRLDPVTISYVGPGGAPQAEESWDEPGTPVYDPQGQWVSDKKESNSRIAYPAENGKSVLIVQGATAAAATSREHTITAVDPATMEPLAAPMRIPEPRFVTMPRTAYDPATNAVFWLTAVGETVQVKRTKWNHQARKFVTTTVGALPADTLSLDIIHVTSMEWNPVTKQLVVISGNYGADESEPRLSRFTPAAANRWTKRTFPLNLPADLLAEYEGQGRITTPFGLHSTHRNLAVFPDGSYVLAGGGVVRNTAEDGTVTSIPIPALQLTTRPKKLVVTAIADSEPVDRGPGSAHWSAMSAADGTVLLTSGSGPFRPLSLQAGKVVAGEEFTLNVAGSPFSSPGLAVDPLTGLNVTTNVSGQKLLFFRGETLVGAQDAPQVNGFFPNPLTIGPDGAIYLPIRTADGFGGIQRLTQTGTVPLITRSPSPVQVAEGASAAFSIAAEGRPAPAIQWQQRAAGASAFVDIDGAVTDMLTVTATAANNGTDYRAVVSSEVGRVASEPATLTVTP